MWSYTRRTGILYKDGLQAGQGYAGHGVGYNNPLLSDVKDVGPLPYGVYIIGDFADRPIVGQFAAPLTPDPANEMFGRADFYMHGDNPEQNHSASDGCIIMPRDVRERVAASGDNRLEVI